MNDDAGHDPRRSVFSTTLAIAAGIVVVLGSTLPRPGSRVVRLVAAVAAVLMATGGIPSPAAADRAVTHCIGPDGVDLNELYGVDAAIVAFVCPPIHAGDHWVPNARWLLNHTFAEVPDGFEPAGATPVADLRAKLLGVRYVIDPGTRQERTYTFTNTENLWIGTAHGTPWGDIPLASTAPMGVLDPLSVGEHTVHRYWRLSGMHCDGLGAVVEDNCLPAGESLFGPPIQFTVLADEGEGD